ncbi:MAG: TonB-dependent receptor [Bacteroidales bacterium]|nr:TonB-dependent receptor [Bacteroidales bacterium]
MKKLLLTLAVIAMAMGAQAAGTLNGLLVDANDSTPLVAATVKLLKANKDSSYVKGCITDDNGLFNLTDVAPGRYVVRCSYLGYEDVTRRVTVEKGGRGVNFGVIPMQMEGVLLKEAVVMGVKTPITVKEDTIEYNADTYKTQANAVVEDILKRMPGVEVDADGKITANGKEIKKILIDGKEFFGDDPKMASKNIPADMINKLQVIDRKSDLARLTGVDDGEDETVINLTVKKGMNNGWFGNATAGYGTNDRYTGNFVANYFTDGNQFTFLGGGNNCNNQNFTDAGAQRFMRFGGNNGITTSQNLGFNFNVGTKDSEKFRAGGNVNYNHSDRDVRSSSDRRYVFPDSTSYYNSASTSRSKGHNVKADFRIQWKPDTCNTLEFRPNFSFNFSDSERADSSMTRAGDAERSPVNRSESSYRNKGKGFDIGGQLVYTHNFKYHPGRSYSMQLRYNYSRTNEDGNTYTHNTYYLKTDPEETIDQIYENHRNTNSVNGRLTWTEPLGNVKNARFLTLAYRGNYKYNSADKMVYDIVRGDLQPTPPRNTNDLMLDMLSDPNMRRYFSSQYGSYALVDGMLLSQIIQYDLGPEIERVLNENQSNRFRNTYYNQSFEVGFRQVRKAYNLNVGFSVNSAMSKSNDLMNSARDIAARWSWSVAPFARLRYKFSKTRNLAFDYRMRASEPSLTQLQPVADVSNPLDITVGNPSLKATFTHRVNLRFSDFDQANQRSIMAMMGVNFTQNNIISVVTYDPTTGGRTTTYDNVNGVWNAMAMNMISFPFGASKVWHFSNHLFSRYSVTKGYNNGELNTSGTFNINLSPGLAFRNSEFDLELRPRYSFQTTHNSVNVNNNRNVHTYGGMFNGTYTAPFGLVLSTDLTFSSTSGMAAGYDSKQWLWNASLGYQFLRGRNASVQLSVFDILQQKKNINRNVTASYIEDAAYNSLTRYAMLTFTYRFTTFAKGSQPEKSNWNNEGRGYGGGGGRPSGPPPGGGRPPF